MSKTLLAPVAVAAALFLAACGGNTPSDNNTAAPADAPATTEPATPATPAPATPATPAPATPATPVAPAN